MPDATSQSAPVRPSMKPDQWVIDRLIILFTHLLRVLPLGATRPLGAGFALLGHALLGKHRRITERNIALVMPELSPAEVRALARQVFLHFGIAGMEYLRMPAMSHAELEARTVYEGREHMDAALARGKGVIILSAHLGNWEWMAGRMSQDGYPLDVISLDSTRATTARLLTAIRSKRGARIYHKNQLLSAIRGLSKNRMLAILADQYDINGIPCTFYGRPTKAPVGPAQIALMTDAAILPIFAVSQPDRHVRITVSPYFVPERTGNKQEDIHRLTQRHLDLIEAVVRAHPEQWLWLHRRWRGLPPELKVKGE